MDNPLRLAAIDLGAESGRVVVGRFTGERVELEIAHRFANAPLWLPDGLHWNVTGLFAETLTGLARAANGAQPLDGIGIDAWGCDYALLDAHGRMLGLPYHYRDERTSPDVLARAHARVSRSELYGRTGTQTLPINTIFQLASEAGGAPASAAEAIALIPDLFGLWLTGTLANELTIASTTGLLEARGRRWATDLIERMGLPRRPFGGEVVDPGYGLGPVLARHPAAAGTEVRAVAGHDTASAFAAAPLDAPTAAVLSSGTWSLLGVELDEPRLGDEAAAANLTNERGITGTVRLLGNVMGLWLLQECRRHWAARGEQLSYAELHELARDARPDVALFDPDSDSLLHAGDMPTRIAALCRAGHQEPPANRGELVRSILVSLACKYRFVLEALERVSGRHVDTVHIVGGGARNALLCQLTADLLGRAVAAGPVEATALGNVLVQAMARGELSGLAEIRAVSARSTEPRRCEPGGGAAAGATSKETYQRFLALTGLAATSPIHTAV